MATSLTVSWSRSAVLSEKGCAVSSEENKAVVRRFFENAGSGERDDELIAEDFVYHGPPMLGEVRGREGFKQLLSGFRAGFPNFETEVTTLIAEGDVVAAWHTHRGQHRGEFAGIPPTGKTVEVHGLELLRVRDGQIAEFWHMDDFLGLMQQIGAVPAPSAAGAPTTGSSTP
jgi:steroid delta-isomerase-like uncharacterized protein